MFTSVPLGTLAFVFVAAVLVGCVFFVSVRRSVNEIPSIDFVWNGKTRTLESTEKGVTVRVFGDAYGEPWDEYVLTIGKRNIGFSTKLPVERTDDGRAIWIVDRMCIRVSRGGKPRKIYSESTKFIDRDEQQAAIEYVKAALKRFDNMYQGEDVFDSIVKFSPDLEFSLSTGLLIAEAG